jgi:hypothetical protein
VEDITIDRRDPKFYGKVSPRVVIMHKTLATYKSEAREANVFAPILRPVYQAILQSISESFAFYIQEDRIPHKVTERKYWGSDNQAANQLTTNVDAIDIENLELTITKESCFNPINQ